MAGNIKSRLGRLEAAALVGEVRPIVFLTLYGDKNSEGEPIYARRDGDATNDRLTWHRGDGESAADFKARILAELPPLPPGTGAHFVTAFTSNQNLDGGNP